MPDSSKRITVVFFRTASGIEPVREWLWSLPAADRKVIGEDLMAVEFGWPIGMPTCRHLERGLWEVRSNLRGGRIARVIFCIREGSMVILNGFIKKSQKTPRNEIDLAISRRKELDQ